MNKPRSVRRWFLAALTLYLAWVGALAAMAVTTSVRPPSQPIPSSVGDDARTPAPDPANR